MGRGQVATLPNAEAPDDDHDEEAAGKPAVAVERDGFNLHAGVRIECGDDVGRERLVRYGARPPLSLERLRRLPGGRVDQGVRVVEDGRCLLEGHRMLAQVRRRFARVSMRRSPSYSTCAPTSMSATSNISLQRSRSSDPLAAT